MSDPRIEKCYDCNKHVSHSAKPYLMPCWAKWKEKITLYGLLVSDCEHATASIPCLSALIRLSERNPDSCNFGWAGVSRFWYVIENTENIIASWANPKDFEKCG